MVDTESHAIDVPRLFTLPSTGETITLRQARYEDIGEMEGAFGMPEGFAVGVWNRELFYRTSSEHWHVMENSRGKLVAVDLGNRLSNGVFLGWHVAVADAYRGLGLTRNFPRYPRGNSLGSATNMALARYPFAAFQFKLLAFLGPCPKTYSVSSEVGRQISIKNADLKKDFREIVAYDREICAVERSSFVKTWSFSRDHQFTVVARNVATGAVCGYGTAREYPDGYYLLIPVYADDPKTAKLLVSALIPYIQGKRIVLYTTDANRTSHEIARDLGLHWVSTEVRAFHRNDNAVNFNSSLDFGKAYTVHEYYPI